MKFKSAILATVSLCAVSLSPALAQYSAQTFEIKQQPLSSAIVALSEQADRAIFVSGNVAAGKTANAIRGEMTFEQALNAMLAGSAIEARYDRSGAVTLVAAGTAQEAQSTSANDTADLLVVQGMRLSRKRGISQKRDADAMVEALGFDELGQLPDKNIGESLNRLSGVSMLVEKGEGRFVQLRGINPSLNNITINGLSMGSTETEGGGRQAPMDILAGGVAGAVQVTKVKTPDQDGQGIGGVVNVDTRSPFSLGKGFNAMGTARFGFEEFTPDDRIDGGHAPYGFDVTLSNTLFDDKLGVLFAGSFSDREYAASGIFQDDWANYAADPVTGSVGGSAPQNVKNNYYIIGRERINLNGVIEYRPTDNATYTLNTFYGNWDEFQLRNRFEQALTQGLVFDTPFSGRAGANRVAANIRNESAKKEVFLASLEGVQTHGDVTLEFGAAVNANETEEDYDLWEFRSGHTFGPIAFAANEAGTVTITPDQGSDDRQDPSLIGFRRVRFQDSIMNENAFSGHIDVTWNAAPFLEYKAGVKYSYTDRSWDYARTRYDEGADFDLGTDPAFTNGAFTNANDAGTPPNLFMDLDAMNAFFNNSANADHFVLNQGDTFAREYSNDYDIAESVVAGYVMGRAEVGAATVIAGARLEHTDVTASAFLFDEGGVIPVEDSGNYTNVLPSLIVNYDLSDTIRLRGAVTKALGRPEYDAIAPRSSFEDDAGVGVLEIGNPGLQARTSWNYDIALEWYPDDFSVFAVSLFKKDISNEIASTTENFVGAEAIASAISARNLDSVIDGSILDSLAIRTTTNNASSDLNGVEVTAQTEVGRFLPSIFDGLGFAGAFAYVDGETVIGDVVTPLLGQAKTSYALSAFYQSSGFDASVSYTYNDSFLTDLDLSDQSLNLDQGKFGRWDAKVSYDVMDGVRVFIEGVNLTDEPTSEFQGGIERRNTEFEYVGRTINVGVSARF